MGVCMLLNGVITVLQSSLQQQDNRRAHYQVWFSSICFWSTVLPILSHYYNNLVYVSEWGNHCVSVFDTKGTFLYCFGKRGSGEGEFQSPCGISTDTFGNLYVSDFGNHRLVVY